jgi:O-antigen biosynthesis protein
LLGLHELLYRMGILRYIPYDTLPRKAVIVADVVAYQQTAEVLRQINYAPELSGRISPGAQTNGALSNMDEMKQLLFVTNVNEVIFCINGLTYNDVFRQMQLCGGSYDYKIHLPGGQSFVGSNSSATSGDLYTMDKRYNLSDFAQLRNKRMVDITAALIFLLLSPFLSLKVKRPGAFISNCFSVLFGSKTWVGYTPGISHDQLPKLRQGIIAPYNVLPGYEPPVDVQMSMNMVYARQYTPGTDVGLLLKNYIYLGGMVEN